MCKCVCPLARCCLWQEVWGHVNGQGLLCADPGRCNPIGPIQRRFKRGTTGTGPDP